MSAARALAQAKINLRLKVLDRDGSGYHSIETVFVRLELADRLTIAVTRGGGLDLRVTGDESLVLASGPADQNLALLAARAFMERTGWNPRVEITVEKVIPVGAGLGGGSADAAAVLRALNSLAPAPLPTAEMLALAARLGSDVPFLVTNDPMAFGWGRGERLMSLPSLPDHPVILAVPPLHVSTAEAYRWLGRARGESATAPAIPGDAFTSWEEAARYAENDFADVVASRHPVIAAMRESLLARGALIAMLAGSGSAVFGVFESEPPPFVTTEWAEIRTVAPAHVVPLEGMD